MKIIIYFCLLSTTLFAEDFTFDKKKGKPIPNFIGEIKVFRGKVYKVNKEGKKQEIEVGTRFFKNDTIITDKKSLAKLIIVDDTILSLGPNSELNFEDYEFVDKTERRTIYSLIKGQIAGHVKNKANEGDIQFKTKAAVMGVRGTELLITHHNIDGNEISQFALLSGETELTDTKGQKSILKKNGHNIFTLNAEKNIHQSEELKLTPQEIEELLAPKIDETADFRPFLAFINVQGLPVDSPLIKLLNQNESSAELIHQEETSTSSADKTDEVEDEKWKENLKKLNEKLKEKLR